MATPPKPADAPPPGGSNPTSIEYAYMFEKNKSPTKLLDALLRAIGRYIVCLAAVRYVRRIADIVSQVQEIGEKDVMQLTPQKLAAFYKAVGGDYDCKSCREKWKTSLLISIALFVEMPHEAISYIWQVTGCQHTLQPTDDDFAPPTIPALTPRGFSRWESLEILLGPEEHVPFLQYAVKNWNLKHPETCQEFPPDLPKEMFPAEADADVDRWHKSCAEKLRKEAAAYRDKETANSPQSPEQPPEPKFSYVHVRNPFPNSRPRPAEPTERPFAYVHVPGTGRTRSSRHSPDKYRQESQSDEHPRRRSVSDSTRPSDPDAPPYATGGAYLDPNAKRPGPPPRRHSAQRTYSSEDSDVDPVHPRMKRRPEGSPPSPPVRHFVPGGPQSGSGPYRHRPDIRTEDPRRRSVPSPSFREKLSEKVSNILPNGKGPERPRNHVRHNSYNNESGRSRRSREHLPPSRLSRSYSDLESEGDSGSDSNDNEFQRRRRMREERDRDRDRDRYRERDRGRPRDPDREREEERRERQYMRRPEVERRTSSHADVDRRRDHPPWDPRNREQVREERKRWDKRMPPDERGPSPVTGVSGRRYPADAPYA